jgi:hypothetical protein
MIVPPVLPSVTVASDTALQPLHLRPSGHSMIGLCAWGTLRYEYPHLLPWVGHHLAAGFDHVFVMIDDVTPSWPRNALHDAQLRALSLSRKVTLVSMLTDVSGMSGTSFLGQSDAIRYCNKLGAAHGFAWMGMWDIDEYVFSSASSIQHVLQRVEDAGAAGMLLPRVMMDPPMPTTLPSADGAFETETQTLRWELDIILGKPMWRPAHAQAANAHGLLVERAEDAVMFGPSGVLPTQTEVLADELTIFFTPRYSAGLHTTAHEQSFNATALDGTNPPLALAHYIHRTSAECLWKQTCGCPSTLHARAPPFL